MAKSLAELFDSLDANTSEQRDKPIVRAPFCYPGAKRASLDNLLPLLPYRERYVEPFGGSGAVLLARDPSPLDVFNDKYAGVVAFYRCLRDERLLDRLCKRLDLTIHSREEFVWCKETWENCADDVERAARWYYMTVYSFSGLGRNWGRATIGAGTLAGKLHNALKQFPAIHERLRRVQIECQDWYDCLIDYDAPGTVFYLDPPYLNTDAGGYAGCRMSLAEHSRMLGIIFSLKGFVALSGYENELYDSQPWNNRFTWSVQVTASPLVFNEGNHLVGKELHMQRKQATECLWIKEARL